ncbi:MAG: rhomboid family intramembrane serine protease [Desulfurococcales archaeon]|nr:rhomboid family intramembrane serine protease [Desulfurococcales archaeon]
MVVWDENPPSMPMPLVTYSLIILNVAVFLITATTTIQGGLTPWPSSNDILSRYGMTPAYVLEGRRLYTIFTSMFLHAGLTHLLGNMLYLFVFGDNVEAVMGRKNFIVLYFSSGIGATLFHLTSMSLIPPEKAYEMYLTTGVTPWQIPAVGASGAISGVLGAYLLLFPHSELNFITFVGPLPVVLRLPAAVYITIWFLFQLIYGIATLGAGIVAGIAFWAHIGGFITGLALAPILVDRDRLRYMIFRSSAIST